MAPGTHLRDANMAAAIDPELPPHVNLRNVSDCQSELRAFAELLRLSKHDLHSFQAVESLEQEVGLAVSSFNSLSDDARYKYAPIDVRQVNEMIIKGVKTDWFKKVRTHEHGIVKLDRCVYPLVQIEPDRYMLPNKNSRFHRRVQNVIQDGKLIIGKNSSALIRFGRKVSSLDGAVIDLSPEEIEFIGDMHVNWVNRVIGGRNTITVLEVSLNTSSKGVVLIPEKEELFSKTCLTPVSGTITNPQAIRYDGLGDIILTYFILRSELHRVDSSKIIARTVELVTEAIACQKEGGVADINPSVYFRGVEGLSASNKGFCAYLLAVSDRSRRLKLSPSWEVVTNEKVLAPSDAYLNSYNESEIALRYQWPWATIMTFIIGTIAAVVLDVFKYEAIVRSVPDYATLCIFLLLGIAATAHNIWYAQWPLLDAMRGIVKTNNTDKLELFLGKDNFVRTIMSIERPDVVFDDHKSCWLAPVRKGKVILHRMIEYGEARKYGVSIRFNNYFEPIFRKEGQFRQASIQDNVIHVGTVIPAQDLIMREAPLHYIFG